LISLKVVTISFNPLPESLHQIEKSRMQSLLFNNPQTDFRLEERLSNGIRWDSRQWLPSIFGIEWWQVACRRLCHQVEAKSIHSLYYSTTMTHPRL
jgi:hypothetical protein